MSISNGSDPHRTPRAPAFVTNYDGHGGLIALGLIALLVFTGWIGLNLA